MQRLYIRRNENISFFILHLPAKRAKARGIAAEPPKRMRTSGARREGDGADSPTRAAVGSEAARPTNCASHNLMENEE
jgi:hypothetical protein